MNLKTGFKKILAVIGIVTIVVPASVSVSACDLKQIFNRKSDNGLIVDAINSVTYRINFLLNSNNNVSNLHSWVCTGFIRVYLDGTARNYFDSSLFIKKEIITENGEEILDSDLQKSGTINAKIVYDYAEFKDQKTNLIIKIE